MVNTFLPFASIEASVRCLDNKRLGKQRVEAYQARSALPLACSCLRRAR